MKKTQQQLKFTSRTIVGYKSLAGTLVLGQHVSPLLYNKLQLQRQALMYKPLREMTY